MLRTGFITVAAVGMFSARHNSNRLGRCQMHEYLGAMRGRGGGGQCDPQTGRWTYGRRGVGGSNKSGAFDACISRELARARRK